MDNAIDKKLRENTIMDLKAQAFKSIYRAIIESLYPGAHNEESKFCLFEHELLPVGDYLEEVEKFSRVNDVGKLAWHLAQKHYEQCHEENPELFHAIFVLASKKQSYHSKAKSYYGIFMNQGYRGIYDTLWQEYESAYQDQQFTLQEIKDLIKTDPRAFGIHYELACPTPLGEVLPQMRR